VRTVALVLDANAFSHKGFRAWLVDYSGPKILPIVAFVELGVHQRSSMRYEQWLAYLSFARIEVEWMRKAEAARTIDVATQEGTFAQNARDFLIAGHVHGDRVLVTDNVRDFAFLPRVVTPGQAMERLG
jgi:predicted nucleic acid-binding protein